ncbi:MAG: biotin/lipoyl-containing protein, partial [Aequorivita vladivostokensis]|nr:biotin/lipoyl-containing protein [Aequorivita vladivostokensis]
MAKFELKLPKMGESVAEATLTNWLKEVGDTIEADEAVLEIATDKVDSEVPSEVDGVLVEKLFNVDDVVQVGQTIAIIETAGSNGTEKTTAESAPSAEIVKEVEKQVETAKETTQAKIENTGDRFYSPLVKNIAAAENISQEELDGISGTGKDGRVTKNDILEYVENRATPKTATPQPQT